MPLPDSRIETLERETPNLPANSQRILVLDDDPDACLWSKTSLERLGYTVETQTDPARALARIVRFEPQLLLCDVRLPGTTGLDVMREAHAIDPNLSVVLMSGYGTVPEAVHALQSGAEHYLTKPVREEELARVVGRSMERQRRLRSVGDRSRVRAITGVSKAAMGLRERVSLAGASSSRVLITGETGSGKEHIARVLHEVSSRARGPFVVVHCAGLSEAQLTQELFDGTSAPGALERSLGEGTLFLDEISEAHEAVQSRLLHALDTRGDALRLVSSTRHDLRARVAAGVFRADLFHRVSTLEINVPPLRTRREDIAPLVDQLLAQLAQQRRSPVPAVTADALEMLARYNWPGNVRELANVLERAWVFNGAAPLTASVLSSRLSLGWSRDETPTIPGATFAELERHAILTTYEACGRNALRAAQVLGLSPRTIHYRLREYRGEQGRRQSSLRRAPSDGSGGPRSDV